MPKLLAPLQKIGKSLNDSTDNRGKYFLEKNYTFFTRETLKL